MRGRPSALGAAERGGFALVIVVLVLGALLLLVTPFLIAARNSDRASSQLFDRASSRIAIDSARVHARSRLEQSHYALDSTPSFDSLDELLVTNNFPRDFLDASDAEGVMWDLDVQDLAGLVDLNSAPPQLISNLLGTTTRLTRAIAPDDQTLPVSSTAGFPPAGIVLVGGEYIEYGGIEGGELIDLQRGRGAQFDSEENLLPGPWPATRHGVGQAVIAQRAEAPALWRSYKKPGDVDSFADPSRLEEASEFALDEGGLTSLDRQTLARLGSVYAGVAAGSTWQRPARLTSTVQAEVDGNLRVDESRWFNPGCTIQITDGQNTEVALVRQVNSRGTLFIDRPLRSTYRAWESEVRVLARRPVNINTAPPEVIEALLTNLQLAGVNSRVTGSEARELTGLIVRMRPFTGFEDFLRWIVLPAAGLETLPDDAPAQPEALSGDGGLIDAADALAIYANALNANHAGLRFSTMPFCFISRDTYRSEIRVAVNAPSGVERHSEGREEVSLVVPQVGLTRAWARQEEFDEELRHRREAPYWMTGPAATSQYNGSQGGGEDVQPPSRLWAGMGTVGGVPYLPGLLPQASSASEDSAPQVEHVFADREQQNGWIQLWPARVEESGERSGRLVHFDHETRDPEGRRLLDQVVRRTTGHLQVQWSGHSSLMRQAGFSLWVKPLSHGNGLLLDVGGTSLESDRLSLSFENGELLLGVLDGTGDHPASALVERGELRYDLAGGNGPGLPLDTWSHIEIDVRGIRPDQLHMLVNGLSHGVRTPGLTRLTASVDGFATTLPVESTEGFPDRGVVRIGNELIEYVLDGSSLNASFQQTGPDAGFGGRNARVRWDASVDPPLPLNLGAIDLNHAEGTAVQVYGYSHPTLSDVPSGSSTLSEDVGPFRVGVLIGVVGGQQTNGDPIIVSINGQDRQVAFGLEGDTSAVTGLALGLADDLSLDPDETDLMDAFNPGGGYVALIASRWSNAQETITGAELGGIEVLRYSGYSDNVLQIAARGSGVNLPNISNSEQGDLGGSRAFASAWGGTSTSSGDVVADYLGWRTFVVPISLPVPGATGLQGFLQADANRAEFAQITEETEAQKTEWVAYNYFDSAQNQLVRDDPNNLLALRNLLVRPTGDVNENPSEEPPGGGGGGDKSGGRRVAASPAAPTSAAPATASAPATAARRAGSQWEPFLGEADDQNLPLSRAVREQFQFRGVLGTVPQRHAAGTSVVPVFHLEGRAPDNGMPGRHDAAFVVGPSFDHIGWPVEVFRGHVPSAQELVHVWEQVEPGTLAATDSGQTATISSVGATVRGTLVALREPQPEPMVAGPMGGSSAATTTVDSRGLTRLTMFPSGERPRIVSEVAVGGGFQSGQGVVPAVLVDELLFSNTAFGTQVPLVDPESTQGAQLVLSVECDEQTQLLEVGAQTLRIPRFTQGTTREMLTDLRASGGLLRIGEELLAYESRDPSLGEITIAPGGRGLLGTEARPHAIGESVTYISHQVVSSLSAGLTAGDSLLELTGVDEFPRQGTVLVDGELIHYTRIRGNALDMPRLSREAGARDGEGAGLFRGRYGTEPDAHGAGAPVLLFPFRYWDRWQEAADGPELAYFGLELQQPAAWWRSLTFAKELPAFAGVDLGILQRTDPSLPWDADPELEQDLAVYWDGTVENRPVGIGAQSDLIQWRIFVDYGPGAFDLETGLGHGWRTTPRLRHFLAFYLAPSMLLRSVER